MPALKMRPRSIELERKRADERATVRFRHWKLKCWIDSCSKRGNFGHKQRPIDQIAFGVQKVPVIPILPITLELAIIPTFHLLNSERRIDEVEARKSPIERIFLSQPKYPKRTKFQILTNHECAGRILLERDKTRERVQGIEFTAQSNGTHREHGENGK